ncbi:HigA family addiction module antitoxin [Hallella sp.]|uniref:HigA family addiction module antitoxin n=1 Tax=Hallella sp. TaxID=2980186 RepID=UPI003079A780
MRQIREDMIVNNLEPFEPTHPGEVIKDELAYRGVTQRQLAQEIGVSCSLLNEVLNGKRAMNAHLAMLIAAALGLDAEPLLNLQTRYDMISAKRNPSFMQRIQAIRKIAAAL